MKNKQPPQDSLGIVWDYLCKHIFRKEEVFTLTFLTLFFLFLYQYATTDYTGALATDWLIGKETMKLSVCFCGILSIVSFLIPKEKEEEKKAVSVFTNYNRLNDNIRDCLVTAMKIDVNKRLEYIKSKPTLRSTPVTLGFNRVETGGSGNDEWNPLLKRDTTIKSQGRNEFFLLQPDL